MINLNPGSREAVLVKEVMKLVFQELAEEKVSDVLKVIERYA